MEGFYRGINLGGWLSQCDYSRERLDHFIREEDFRTIASWGLDHVRLPVDYNVLEEQPEDAKAGGPVGLGRVVRAVGLARKHGLNVVVDLHKTPGYSFDAGEKEAGFFESEKYQERFYELWERLAEAFGDDPEHILFDLLNEITDREVLPQWQRVSAECVRRIRKYAPDTRILIGSYDYNDVRAVADLDLPEDDRLVYSFHCYEPHFYTHQGAYWDAGIDRDRRVSFEEANIDDRYFDRLFETAVRKAAEEGRELYCGEFGVIDVVPPEDAIRWFRVLHRAFERYGIGRAVWSYREMDFGLADARMDGVRDELLTLL